MPQIESDLKALCEFAKELGANDAVSFSSKDVVVDERVRLKCLIPPCDDLGLNLMCPPFVMSVQEFKVILSKYSWAILIQIEAPISTKMRNKINKTGDLASLYGDEDFLKDYRSTFDPIRMKLHKIINRVEAKASMFGYRFATGFKAGPCKLCSECAVKDSITICKHPYQSRPAMEAVGIDVFKTAENAGLHFDFLTKDKAVWNGLVLVN